MQSIINVLVVGPVEDKEWDGRKYKSQECQCVTLNDDGTPSQVGVLRVPADMLGQVKTGIHIGRFAIRPDRKTRVLGGVLVGLEPYTVPKAPPAPAAPAAAPATVKPA